MTTEHLIEEAARRYPDNTHMKTTPFYAQMKRDAFIAGALFEEAHTPTNDEREALRVAHLDARQTAYREHRALWFRDYDYAPKVATNAFFCGWDAAVDGGFRRSEVPEPSAPMSLADDPMRAPFQKNSEPQGESNVSESAIGFQSPAELKAQDEPSDAQVKAVATAIRKATSPNTWSWDEVALAALRAAGVTEQGENR